MAPDVIYSDRLIEIGKDWIRFLNYYFPFGSKRVAFSEVDGVVAKEPTWSNGKWRIQGTVDFRTWFPRDWKRPARDRIFFISFAGKRSRIGFTAEDSQKVTNILNEKGLLLEELDN